MFISNTKTRNKTKLKKMYMSIKNMSPTVCDLIRQDLQFILDDNFTKFQIQEPTIEEVQFGYQYLSKREQDKISLFFFANEDKISPIYCNSIIYLF